MVIDFRVLRADTLAYKIEGEIIYANTEDKVYKIDMSGFGDGLAIEYDSTIISGAFRKNGVLQVTLFTPVDTSGNEILQEDFSIDNCEHMGIKWKTQKEIKDEKLLESLMPTKDDIENAELEIKTINLLQDLEVI